MPRCASYDRGATPVNTIWPRLAMQAMTDNCVLPHSVQLFLAMPHLASNDQGPAPQDVQLNLAMPRLASNDRAPAVMTKGQHR